MRALHELAEQVYEPVGEVLAGGVGELLGSALRGRRVATHLGQFQAENQPLTCGKNASVTCEQNASVSNAERQRVSDVESQWAELGTVLEAAPRIRPRRRGDRTHPAARVTKSSDRAGAAYGAKHIYVYIYEYVYIYVHIYGKNWGVACGENRGVPSGENGCIYI